MCGVRVHASYATIYKWGYLHEALNTYGAHDSQLLSPCHQLWVSHAACLT